MKVSKKTVDILKNFSTINNGIVVKGDSNKIRTINIGGTMCGIANIDSFSKDFAIYDLPEFLNMLGAFEDPNVDLDDGFMTISGSVGRSRCKYGYADASLIQTIDSDIDIGVADITFILTQADLTRLNRAGQIMGCPDLIVENDDGKIMVRVLDKTDNSSNSFEVEVGKCDTNVKFSFHFKTEPVMKLMPYEYNVAISKDLISCFSNEKEGIEYFISLEDTSSYEG